MFFDVVRREEADRCHRVLTVIDSAVAAAHPTLTAAMRGYFAAFPDALETRGRARRRTRRRGDQERLRSPVRDAETDHTTSASTGNRSQSWSSAAGGPRHGVVRGSHRPPRCSSIRFPTTVLSQADSGFAVKNGINLFGKKNFVGTFVPPFAVINDSRFLETLSDRATASAASPKR
jgi:3-dehydroquinate synthase